MCMCGACPYRGRERERENEEKIKRSNIEREQMKRREREKMEREIKRVPIRVIGQTLEENNSTKLKNC